MRYPVVSLIVSMAFIFFCQPYADAKKIRLSHSVEKSSKSDKKLKETQSLQQSRQINLADSLEFIGTPETDLFLDLKKIDFSGYDKEPYSSVESFILTNPTDRTLLFFKVKIDYLDMKGRMLHSRIVELDCEVPPQESRKFDIASWDKQHTYYYYLGNEPKKVATPFQVKFLPLSFRVKEDLAD